MKRMRTALGLALAALALLRGAARTGEAAVKFR